MKYKINTVVFDIYETIIFSKKGLKSAPLQAFINTFNYYDNKNYNNDKKFISIVNKYMGNSKKKHLELIINDINLDTKKSIDEIYTKFNEIQCEILKIPDYCVIDKEYYKTVEIMKQIGIKNICATTGFNYLQTSLILQNNPNLKLDKIITTNDVINPRPNPEGIYKIINDYNLKNNNIIKLGDTIADIQEANNAKIISIGITTGSILRKEFEKNNANYVIDKLSELPELIKNINL